MKKIITLCLAAAVLVTMVTTGSVAYFTDMVRSDDNVIAAGNLDIAQHEWERGTDDDGNAALVPFEQNKDFLPGVVTLPENGGVSDVTVNLPADLGEGRDTVNLSFTMHSGNIQNYVDKIVCVENEGSLPVYVRTYVAVPAAYVNNEPIEWIHLDFNTADGWTLKKPDSSGNLTEEDYIIPKQTIGGVTYDIYVATLTEPLSSAEIQVTAHPAATPDTATGTSPVLDPNPMISSPSLLGFYMDSRVSNEDGYFVYIDGNQKTRLWETENTELSILVCTAAAQARVFDDVWEAMDATYNSTSSVGSANGLTPEMSMVVKKMQAMVANKNTTP